MHPELALSKRSQPSPTAASHTHTSMRSPRGGPTVMIKMVLVEEEGADGTRGQGLPAHGDALKLTAKRSPAPTFL